MECHKCNRLGHTRSFCLATQPTCALCSGDHEMTNCESKNDTSKHKCINCRKNHPAFSKKCHLLISSHGGSRVSDFSYNNTFQGTLNEQSIHKTQPIPAQPNHIQPNPIQPTNHWSKNLKNHSSYLANITHQTPPQPTNYQESKNLILTSIITTLTQLLSANTLNMSSLNAIHEAINQISKNIHEN